MHVLFVLVQEMTAVQVFKHYHYYYNYNYSFVVMGECNHVFHMHCIVKWMEKQEEDHDMRGEGHGRATCPICRQKWNVK